MTNPILKLGQGQFQLELCRCSFPNEKYHIAFAKKCVTMVRMSPEYKDWVSYVKDTLGHKFCAITSENSDELTVEIHHHPFSLFDATMAVLNRYLMSGDTFTSLDIVKDVLIVHYTDNIGYIPLVTSLHEKYHNGFLTIPPKFILGTWDYFLSSDEYEIDEATLLKVQSLMAAENNKHDCYVNWQKAEVDNNV